MAQKASLKAMMMCSGCMMMNLLLGFREDSKEGK